MVADEILAQRLGLVPLNVDPSLIEIKEGGYVLWSCYPGLNHLRPAPDVATDRNTIVFRLQVTCTRNKKIVRGETDPERLYNNANGKHS